GALSPCSSRTWRAAGRSRPGSPWSGPSRRCRGSWQRCRRGTRCCRARRPAKGCCWGRGVRSSSLRLLEGAFVVACDFLVALRERLQLGGADHRVDVPERPVAGALVDLAQDGVGRVAAILEHDVGGRAEALRLVVL